MIAGPRSTAGISALPCGNHAAFPGRPRRRHRVDHDGLVHALTEGGLGADTDFDLIERKKVGALS
jgi:hypothetical protein